MARLARLRPTRETVVLYGILAAALVLRLWSLRSGLPSVHNLDEQTHFTTSAAKMTGGSLNPHYFQNPPGFTYLLHLLFTVVYGFPGGPTTNDIEVALKGDPSTLYTISRAASALLGVGACGGVYVAARRLFGSTVGLLSAAFLGATFLPVFYSHLALNDVPTLFPVSIAMIGIAGIATRERTADYVVAGAGLGAATATKYTAAALALGVIVAWLARQRDESNDRHRALALLMLAGGVALAAFVVLNPYSVLDFREFVDGVRRQQQYTAEISKVGLDDTSGWQYYLWTLTWGLGVVPVALAIIGSVSALRTNWRTAAPWVVTAVVTWLFLGSQVRFYARWLLPAYPVVAAFAAVGLVAVGRAVAPRWRTLATVGLGVAAFAQPVVTAVHSNVVLGRTDTRDLAKAWLIEHVGPGERVVMELMSSRPFFNHGSAAAGEPVFDLYPQPRGKDVERYAFTLTAETIDSYVAGGYCTVVTASTQRDRALKERIPGAAAYYRALSRRATRIARFSPMRDGRPVPSFNFDISYNWYPLGYVRPGPEVDVYRLTAPRCQRR